MTGRNERINRKMKELLKKRRKEENRQEINEGQEICIKKGEYKRKYCMNKKRKQVRKKESN